MKGSVTLETAYDAFLEILERSRQRYLVIGALAVGLLGEARMTRDLDFLVFLPPGEMGGLLQRLKRRGFAVDFNAAQRQADETGTFRVFYHSIPIDCLIASTPLEDQMWRRAKRLRLHRRMARFPSPEDLILLKLLPGRPKDLWDAQSVLIRHRGKLNFPYLKRTAQRMADELQDAGVWHRLQQLLKT